MPPNDKIAGLMLFSQEGSACQRQQNGRKQTTLRRAFKLPRLSLPKGTECGSCLGLGWAGCVASPHTSGTPQVDGRALAQLMQDRGSLRPGDLALEGQYPDGGPLMLSTLIFVFSEYPCVSLFSVRTAYLMCHTHRVSAV